MTNADELRKAFGDVPAVEGDALLRRIANATELQAALAAYDFFEAQVSEAAKDKLRAVIQKRASNICNGGK